MKDRAKSFRKQLTPAEKRMWYFLRDRRLGGHKFIREMAIGSYVADFACRSQKIIVEIDGAQHAKSDAIQYDKERTLFLEKQGYRVIRFWNDDVFKNINGVLDAILNFLHSKKR